MLLGLPPFSPKISQIYHLFLTHPRCCGHHTQDLPLALNLIGRIAEGCLPAGGPLGRPPRAGVVRPQGPGHCLAHQEVFRVGSFSDWKS